MNIPRDTIGHTVFAALLPERGAASASNRDVLIEPDLIVRDSAGPVSAQRAHRGARVSGGNRASDEEA